MTTYGRIPFTRATPSMLKTAMLAYHVIRHRIASLVSNSPSGI
jgi:hypothetical protein